MPRRGWWIVPLVAAAAVLFVWTNHARGPGEGPPTSPSSQRAAAGQDAGSLRGDAASSGREGPAGGVLAGRVVPGERGAGVPVTLHPLPSSRPEGPLRRVEAGWFYEHLLSGDPPVATTHADGGGRFRLDHVPRGEYELRAVGSGGERATTRVSVPAGTSRRTLVLRLPSGPPLLRGHARYADGRPFHGLVRVQATDRMRIRQDPFGVEVSYGTGAFPTDEDGRFVVRDVAEGEARLVAVVPGRETRASAVVRLPYDGAYEFVVDDAAVGVLGRVTDAATGVGIVRATVEVWGRRRRGEVQRVRTRTDGAGAFRVRVPHPVRWMRADAPGYAPRVFGDAEVWADWSYENTSASTGPRRGAPVPSPASHGIEIALEPAARVHGRVLGDGGAPVAGIAVFAVPADRAALDEARSTAADERGRYRLDDLPPGEIYLVAGGSGHVTEGLEGIGERGGWLPSRIALAPGDDREQDIRVVAGASLAVRVVGPEREPIRGATVACLPSWNEPAADGFPFGRFGVPCFWPQQTTDAEGRCRFESLLAGFPYRVQAHAEAYPVKIGGAIWPGTEEQVVVLDRPCALDVRVTTDAGDPVPGARVGFGYGGVGRTWPTGDDGRAHLEPVAPGKHYLWAGAEGYVSPERLPSVDLPATEGRDGDAAIVLAPAAWIEGRVVVPEKDRGGQVSVFPHAGGSWGNSVDEDLRFRVGPLRPGPVLLETTLRRASRPQLRLRREIVAPAKDVVLDLAEGEEPFPQAAPVRVWNVRVLDANGDPVSTAQARLRGRYPTGGDVLSRPAFYAGHATRVEAGRCSPALSVHAGTDRVVIDVFQPGPDAVGGALFDHPLPLEGGDATVRLPAAEAVKGRMRWEDGLPAAGVRLVAVPAATSEPEDWYDSIYDRPFARWSRDTALASTRTDANGAFLLEGLGPGAVDLVPALPPDALLDGPTRVSPPSNDVEIVLRRGVAAWIEVRGPDGRPVGDCTVAVRTGPEVENLVGGRTNGAGRFRVPGLEPDGSYELEVQPEDDTGLATEVRRAWEPAHIVVRLVHRMSVEGEVSGTSASTMCVWWRRAAPGETWAGALVGKAGRFRIDRVREGETVLLLALPPAAGPPKEPSPPGAVLARAGDHDVLLIP